MIASLDRHLKNKGYSLSIVYVHDHMLEGKAKQLRLAGRVKRPTKLDKYQRRMKKFSERVEKWEVITPKSLFQTMWWLLTQHIRLCGRQEHHGMRLEDFRIMNWWWRPRICWVCRRAYENQKEVWVHSRNSFSLKCFTPGKGNVQLLYCWLHLLVNARAQNMFSRDVKHLSFRCQTLKFSRPNVKFYFSTLVKEKKGRNHQKGIPLSSDFAESSERTCTGLFFFRRAEKWEVITPESLFQTMWWLLIQHIRLCGRQEHLAFLPSTETNVLGK